MGFYTKQPDKKSGDGLALTEWNDLSNAVAGNAGLTLALKTEDSIGIGTKEPKMKLHVQNAGAIINGISIGDAPAYATKKEHGYETIGVNDASHVLRLLAPNGLRIQTGTDQAERVTISKDGEVTAAKFIGDGSQLTNLSVGETGLNLATTSGSKVGIGTASPAYKLDVHGGLRVTNGINTSSLYASGNIRAGSFTGDGSGLTNLRINMNFRLVWGPLKVSSWINNYDGVMDAKLGEGDVMVGLYSEHHNSHEDRRFKIYYRNVRIERS